MSFQHRTSFRLSWKFAATILFVLATISPAVIWTTRAASNAGVRDFAFANGANAWNIDSAPTATKPQSKLWFNDGSWWGSLLSKSAGQYRIYRFNTGPQTWTDTGTVVDSRKTSHMDCLWDGSHLYIATAVPPGTSGDASIKVLRFSYNSSNGQYSQDNGFPITVATNRVEAVVLDKDSTGALWVTYTADNGNGGRSVYAAHSGANGSNWIAPFVIPANGAGNLTSDDISAVIAYDGKIGIMWSNQNDSTLYFATHSDGAADNQWQQNPALQGPNYADDHINLKSLQKDPYGRVYAAVKTSLNDNPSNSGNSPLTLLLTLDEHGSWSRTTFGRISDDHTRPIVLIDSEHNDLYMFATSPSTPGGSIYYKKTSLDNLSFSTGVGTAFILSGSDPNINNATSTKQTLNSNTGLLVLASDIGTGFYLHNYMSLGGSSGDTSPPSAPTGLKATAVSASEVDLTWSASTDDTGVTGYTILRGGGVVGTVNGSTLSYNDTTVSPSTTYSYTVTAKDAAGNVSQPSTSASVTTPAAPSAIDLPGRIEAEDYLPGGEGVGYHDTTAGNAGGAYRQDDVDIQSTADSGGGYNVGWIDTGEWLKFNVNVTTAGNYTFAFRVATPNSGQKLHVELDGSNITGTVNVPNTGGFQSWQTVTTGPIALPSGTHSVRLLFDTKGFNLNYVDVATAASPTTPADPTGLTASAVSSGEVDLSWTDNAGNEDNYVVERQTSGSSTWTVLTSSLPANTTSYTDTSVSSNTTYTYRVKAINGAGSSGYATSNAVTTPATPSAISLPGHFEAEDYTSFHDTTAGNTGGAYRTDDVDIQTCSDSSTPSGKTCYNVGWTAAGEWLGFDVNIGTAGNYTFALRVATVYSGKTMHLELDGAPVGGTITIQKSGGWQTWETVTSNPMALPSGPHMLKIVFDTGQVNLNYVDVTAT